MTIAFDLLKELSEKSFNYKGMRVDFLGLPKFKNHSPNSLRGTMSYLLKEGFVEDCEGLHITMKGKDYINKKIDSLKQFDFKFKKDAPKDLIVMFDVPEPKKAEREWLRWHLKKFNYIMIQKSVWVGPSPLPKKFLDYIENIGLKESLKTFKLAKGYNIKK
ncbi:CRISPR-associated endonuclease Cas2 [Candidatus Nomurabacteria bacterium]|nr:CRISPR-associated endonuclease Cas2 [Candidatus Nomurabacteria bacterium]